MGESSTKGSTITVRLIKSFEYKNIKNMVLHDFDLNMSVPHLKALVLGSINFLSSVLGLSFLPHPSPLCLLFSLSLSLLLLLSLSLSLALSFSLSLCYLTLSTLFCLSLTHSSLFLEVKRSTASTGDQLLSTTSYR